MSRTITLRFGRKGSGFRVRGSEFPIQSLVPSLCVASFSGGDKCSVCHCLHGIATSALLAGNHWRFYCLQAVLNLVSIPRQAVAHKRSPENLAARLSRSVRLSLRRSASYKALAAPTHRDGFSLLEVILALAILAGAAAVLGEIARNGLESTRIARDLTYAQLMCESKLAEITSGAVGPDPVSSTAVDITEGSSRGGWLYSVEVDETDVEGLLSLRVTVTQDMPEDKHPVHCTLVRWLVDPDAVTSDTSSTETTPSS